MGSLQAQRAIQTRWWHHSQVLQGQSISGLSNKGCDSRLEPCFLSVFVVFRPPPVGWKRIEDKPTPWSALPLGKIVVVPSLSLAPAITGRYDPTLPGTTF